MEKEQAATSLAPKLAVLAMLKRLLELLLLLPPPPPTVVEVPVVLSVHVAAVPAKLGRLLKLVLPMHEDDVSELPRLLDLLPLPKPKPTPLPGPTLRLYSLCRVAALGVNAGLPDAIRLEVISFSVDRSERSSERRWLSRAWRCVLRELGLELLVMVVVLVGLSDVDDDDVVGAMSAAVPAGGAVPISSSRLLT